MAKRMYPIWLKAACRLEERVQEPLQWKSSYLIELFKGRRLQAKSMENRGKLALRI